MHAGISEWQTVKRVLARGWRYRGVILAAVLCTATLGALLGWLFLQMQPLFELLSRAQQAAGAEDAARSAIAHPCTCCAHIPGRSEIADGFRDFGLRLLPAAIPAALAAFGAWWFGQLVANLTMRDLRNEVLAHLVRTDLGFHQQLARGEMLTRLTTDLLGTLRLQQVAYGKVLLKPLEAVGLTVALLWIDLRLAAVVGLVLLPAMVVLWPLLQRTRRRSRQARDSQERNFGVLEQITAGIKVIKAMGSAEREVQRYAGSNAELVRANMRLAKTRAQSDGLTNGAIFLLAGLGMIACGVLFDRRLIEPGALLSFLAILGRLINVLREAQRGWGDLQEQIPAAQRVFELLDRPSALAERPGAPPCPAPRQSIALEGVRFRYAADAGEVLRGIDLIIPVGRTTALVGSSGGGKSTIIDLIPRFHDATGGRVTWDGVDVRDGRLDSIAAHVAVVSQDAFLFDDTIRANIAYGRPEASDAEIEAAARRAHLHDDILRLEGGQGYATRVGDRGGRLSGGQRQRVAIARALLRDAPVLLLDEPTSALDAHSEAHVQAALAELMRGRTVVVVAHRLATVQRADRIYVIAGKDDPEPGTVLESGTHSELLARGGRYAQLAKLQAIQA
jgi:ATP-binding cassette, subfamily B, bacterial MsbA